MSRIAFIGLGNMGAPMANNLLKAGHQLAVFDLVPGAANSLADAGARPAGSAADAAQGAEIVITMLPARKHVEALYLESDWVAAIDPAALAIDCSTIAADLARKVALAAQARNLAMIDAPVSGGMAGAVAGTLTFIVGGEAAALDRAMPVLQAMGKNIFHAGPPGAGQMARICNNMLLGILMAGTSEALALGVAHGLDPQVLFDIIAQNFARNGTTELYNPWPGVMANTSAAQRYAGGFGVDLMLKDLGLAVEAALSTRSSIPLGELARNLYSLHSSGGYGKLDLSSIVNLYTPKAP